MVGTARQLCLPRKEAAHEHLPSGVGSRLSFVHLPLITLTRSAERGYMYVWRNTHGPLEIDGEVAHLDPVALSKAMSLQLFTVSHLSTKLF